MSDAEVPGSVPLSLYTPEAALMAQALGDGAGSAPLAGRLLAACQEAQANGSTTLQISATPLEQGLMMGALRQCTCSFSSGLRWRLQQLMVGQLLDMDAPKAL